MPPPTSAGTSGSAPGTETGDPEPGSSSTGLVDVGGAGPNGECVSVMQTAEMIERPNDVIMIGDSEADGFRLRAAVSNLPPQLVHEGIEDAHTILIAGTPPPLGSDPEEDQYFTCGRWECWEEGGANAQWHFEYLDHELGPTTLLTDFVALSDQWLPLLREEAWKHLWLFTSRGEDAELTADAFAETFAALGPGLGQFVVHVAQPSDVAPGGFIELAQATGGEFFPGEGPEGGASYLDFSNAVEEQLRSNTLECVVDIPAPPEGAVFDPDRVNVEFDDGLGVRTIGYVESHGECATVGHGWYYDDPVDPQSIAVCPSTCDLFQSQEVATVEVIFGCATIPAA